MKVLVTGSNGFIGKNLCLWLKQHTNFFIFGIDLNNQDRLEEYLLASDFVVNLAGINRPINNDEFYDGNVNFMVKIVDFLVSHNMKTPILYSSSIQAAENNEYGKSKKMAEEYLLKISKQHHIPIYIYRFQNVFGKWCRPNYNSVVATFCYNIARGLAITVNDYSAIKEFVYIDDICKEICSLLNEEKWIGDSNIRYIKEVYPIRIGDLAKTITQFHENRKTFFVPCFCNEFYSKLYATYLSYLEEHNFDYPLNSHTDSRGSFTEIFKSIESGQISVNIGKPGIVKGNHYHNTKNEKFVVLKGIVSIKFRKINDDKVFEYIVSGEDMKIIDIPVGYIHSITNIGTDDSITLMWASELFNPEEPDTFFEEVIINEK